MSKNETKHIDSADSGNLEGQLLIAMPSIADDRFDHAVIYICAHSDDGAMGIIINQKAPQIDFVELMEQLEILPEADDKSIILPTSITDMNVHMGGPVETGRGFVLHSPDYFADNATLAINDSVYLTATIDILKAIANGSGPQQSLLALGYAGWSPGQLEAEILDNGWLNCPGDAGIIFDANLEGKYQKALSKLGIDPSHLVSSPGHA